MALTYQEYDPVHQNLRDPAKQVFKEVAGIVGPREGKAYLDAHRAAGNQVPDEEYDNDRIGDYVEGMVFNFLPGISMELSSRFNREAAVEPADLRTAYAEIKTSYEQHFDGQLKAEETAQDKIFNAHVRLYKATASTFIDRMVARLP